MREKNMSFILSETRLKRRRRERKARKKRWKEREERYTIGRGTNTFLTIERIWETSQSKSVLTRPPELCNYQDQRFLVVLFLPPRNIVYVSGCFFERLEPLPCACPPLDVPRTVLVRTYLSRMEFAIVSLERSGRYRILRKTVFPSGRMVFPITLRFATRRGNEDSFQGVNNSVVPNKGRKILIEIASLFRLENFT